MTSRKKLGFGIATSICAVCLLSLISCSAQGDGEGNEAVLPIEGTVYSTPYLCYSRGAVISIGEEEFSALLSGSEPLERKEVPEEVLPSGMTFTVTSATLEVGEPSRVSAVFSGAVSIGAMAVTPCDAVVKEDGMLSRKERVTLRNAVAEIYGFETEGSSAITDGPWFPVADSERYSAVIFYPYTYVVRGQLLTESGVKELELRYPCVNPVGALDGLYAVESQELAEDIPD